LRLRIAQPTTPPSFLALALRHRHGPVHRCALPATDDQAIWLPANFGTLDAAEAWQRYRMLALRQAMRAMRGSATHAPTTSDALVRDLYL
jgi:nitric oxide reductase NorD protein